MVKQLILFVNSLFVIFRSKNHKENLTFQSLKATKTAALLIFSVFERTLLIRFEYYSA